MGLFSFVWAIPFTLTNFVIMAGLHFLIWSFKAMGKLLVLVAKACVLPLKMFGKLVIESTRLTGKALAGTTKWVIQDAQRSFKGRNKY